jgi:hypothetical protein
MNVTLFWGHYMVSLIFIPKPFHYLNRSQALRMASQYFECAQQEGKIGRHDTRLHFLYCDWPKI